MLLIENIRMAVDSIFSNLLRSFLTMLGIIIGVASVITILAVGNGATSEVTSTFTDVGATTISLSANDTKDEVAGEALTLDDLETLKEAIDEIQYITPMTRSASQVRAREDLTKLVIVQAGNLDTQYASQSMSSQLIHGRYFNQQELDNEADVVVIDADLAKARFNRTNVVGESIRIVNEGVPMDLLIVGVTEGMYEEFQGAFDADELPAFASVPYTTFKKYLPSQAEITDAQIVVENTEQITKVSQQAVRLLELRHDAVGKNIYTAQNFLNALEQVNSVLTLFIQFIAAVAGIALFVGGIGVMNIMLVSVTERTREIGTRKALGATTSMILVQFLIEAVLISLIGGLVGLVLGIVISNGLGNWLNVVPIVTAGNVASVLIFSFVIGVFFGIYPAKRAADLNPIDALRYE